jgi:Flp pilus assembly protein TadG
MLHSIRNRFTGESGSAVVGFAIGAPFVLLTFVGFLELSHISWKSITASTGAKFRLLAMAQENTAIVPNQFSYAELNEITLIKPKGAEWNLWRIKE